MKPAFIQYQNLGKELRNNDFTIYSDKGVALPSGLNSDQLLAGSIVQLPDEATKVFVTPNIYDIIASGNAQNLSGLKFKKVNDTPIFIPGLSNYGVTQVLTGSNLNNYRFGEDSMRISNNGNVIIVTKNSTFGVPNTGLFIFTGVSGQNWALRQTIPHPSGITNPAGYSSALTSNGSIIATSSWGINGSPGFIFVYTGTPTGGWNLFQTITGTSINSGFARNIAINEANPFSSGPSYLAATEKKKVSVYRFTTGGYILSETIEHPDISSDSSNIAMSDTIRTSQNIFASYIIIGTPNSSGALVYRQTFLTGWAFDQKLSGSQFDGSSVSINRSGDILVLGNRLGGSVGGYANIYTGRNILSPLRFRQQISGFGFQSQFADSVSIKDTTIVVGSPGNVTLGDNGVGRVFIYTGSKENGWALSRSFTGTNSPSIQLGEIVDIYRDTVIASAPKLSNYGAINVYNPTSFTNVETYLSEKNLYAIWQNPVMNYWILSQSNQIGQNLTSPNFFFNSNGNYSNGTGLYTGINLGSLTISKINNKLHVYNTPGISGFAGTYSSGTFTIAGTPRVGFRNDQNPDFYIYKNSLPSAWRAVQDLYNGTFTWYSATGRQGVDEDPGQYPPVTDWRLGDNSVMNPPPVTDAALPLPEMNFGHCAGNTLIYPNFVYQMNSANDDIDNIKLYSGGMLSDSGTSELFPQNINITNLLPYLYNKYIDKNFYYSNVIQDSRFLLFRIINNDFDQFVITKTNQNYNSGYYYWISDYDYTLNSGKDSLQQARKVFIPVGNNTGTLKNISVDINDMFLYKNINTENLDFDNINSGDNIYVSVNKPISGVNLNGFYTLQNVNNDIYKDLNILSGRNNYLFASPKFYVSGVTCGNQAFTLNPTVGLVNQQTGFVQFVRATEGFQFEVQFTRNLQSGWSTTGVTLTPSSSQSNVPSGFIREEFYLPLSELAGGNLFFRMSGTNAVWKILDTDFNYVGITNCLSSSKILPSKYWFTGKWDGFAFRDYYDIGYIKLYLLNQTLNNLDNFNDNYILGYNNNYDYTQYSGYITGVKSNELIFNLPDGQSLTGLITTKSTGFIGGLINSRNSSTLEYANFAMQNLDKPSDSISGKYSLSINYNDINYSIEYTGGSFATYIKYSKSQSRYTCFTNI